ncbi:MAG: DNA polymerase III subunit gamma/tau, partial [Chthoniobacterales bacterium]
YRVFARKYRPQTFDEVIGQEHVTRTLQNAITQKRLAQAYLFVGPRGIGKTSTARILAKALNCANGPTATPCGICDACKEIAAGNSLDVLEIDGASNNSVEHVRELRENVAYAPARGPYKIYLIDEVHMLSTAAFNALLKTLEEPPEHVKFIFATTEAQKLPPTITSRCQRFDLRRIPPEAIAKHLLLIAKTEKIELDGNAAVAIARGADGGLRDAESMLDQVVAFCGDKVAYDDVLNIFGFTSPETVGKLCDALFAADTLGALKIIHEQNEAGKDLLRLLAEMVGSLRDLLVATVTGVQAGNTPPPARLLELIEHFSAVESRMRWAPDKKLHTEVAVIKAIHLLNQATLDDVLDTLGAIQGGEALPSLPARPVAKPAPARATPPPEASAPSAPRVAEEKPKAASFVDLSEPPALSAAKETAAPAPSASDASSEPFEIWERIITRLAHDSPLKFQWLTTARFATREGAEFRIQIPRQHHARTGDFIWPDLRKIVEAELSKVVGGRAKLGFELADFDHAPSAEEASEPPPRAAAPVVEKSPNATPPKPEKVEEKSQAEADAEFKNDPLIKKALEIFGREIQTSS